MSKTKISVSNDEDLVRAKRMILSRDQAKNEVDALFNRSKPARKADVKKMEKLLVQAPAAQVQTPNLQKEAVARNVTNYFEKKAYLTEAQKRFPELLKAGSTETQPQRIPSKKVSGQTPVRAEVSGGHH